MSKQIFSLRMSVEELICLLDILDLKTLPGLGAQPLQLYSEVERQTIIASGYHSLRAKGWISDTPNAPKPIGVDTMVFAPLLVCGTAKTLMIFSKRKRAGDPEQIYLHIHENLIVLHRLIEQGVHEFVSADNLESIVKAIIELFEIKSESPKPKKNQKFVISDSQKMINALQKPDLDSLIELLNQDGIAVEIQQEFLEMIKTGTTMISVVKISFPLLTEQSKDLKRDLQSLLIDEKDHLWILKEGPDNKVTASKASIDDVVSSFVNWN